MLNVPLVQKIILERIVSLASKVKASKDSLQELFNYLIEVEDLKPLNNVLEKDSSCWRARFRETVIFLENKIFCRSRPDMQNYSLKGVKWPLKVLQNYCVAGVDTSEITPSVHFSPPFLLINVGLTFISYGDKLRHIEKSEPYFYFVGEGETENYLWNIQRKRVESELETIKNSLFKLREELSSEIYVLFDESFSVNYLASKTEKERKETVEAMKKAWTEMKNKKIIPVGVFYTNSSAVSASLIRAVVCEEKKSCSVCMKEKRKLECEKLLIEDKLLFNYLLSNSWRSSLFKVVNKIVTENSLEVAGFYFKAGERNVFRVEFPLWAAANVQQIYSVVAGQAGLGGGYPYLLERAHEQALIKNAERRWVLSYVNKLLNEKYNLRLLFSKKQEKKIKGVV